MEWARSSRPGHKRPSSPAHRRKDVRGPMRRHGYPAQRAVHAGEGEGQADDLRGGNRPGGSPRGRCARCADGERCAAIGRRQSASAIRDHRCGRRRARMVRRRSRATNQPALTAVVEMLRENLDRYEILLYRSATYQNQSAREQRRTTGARYFNRPPNEPPTAGFDYNVETGFQWGFIRESLDPRLGRWNCRVDLVLAREHERCAVYL